MRIDEIIANKDFEFIGNFRVMMGDSKVYDTTESPDIPVDLLFAKIIGISIGSDGILEFKVPD